MKARNEIIRSKDYWLTIIQNKIYAELVEYMEKNNLTQKEVAEELNVSASYISQVLNGNFNFTIGKLINLSLYVKKALVIEFKDFDTLILEESFPVHKMQFTVRSDSNGGTYTELGSELRNQDTFILPDTSYKFLTRKVLQ